jgi:hypothetical protein
MLAVAWNFGNFEHAGVFVINSLIRDIADNAVEDDRSVLIVSR